MPPRLTDYLSRIVLVVGALAIVTMVLFPPWRFTIHRGIAAGNLLVEETPGGYAFIASPPEADESRCPACWHEYRTSKQVLAGEEGESQQYRTSVRMDSERLTVQILGAGIACGLLALALRRK